VSGGAASPATVGRRKDATRTLLLLLLLLLMLLMLLTLLLPKLPLPRA
jgi:hypothetical protein